MIVRFILKAYMKTGGLMLIVKNTKANLKSNANVKKVKAPGHISQHQLSL